MNLFTHVIRALPASTPFVGPEALERRSGNAISARLGANENVFGASPHAIAAMQRAATESWQYADPENHGLKLALASHCGVTPDNIVVAEGIDSLLGLTVRLFLEPGETAATSLGAYPTFNFHVAAQGGRLATTPYVDDREHPPSLLELATRDRAKLIYFANPDNPMGSHWSAADVQALIDAVPDHAILLLDEAYGEFAPEGTSPAIDVAHPRLLRFRTFSKAYGMAGVRVGYAIGHKDLIQAFEKVRNHFGMTRMGQAGALAALADSAWLSHVAAEVDAARRRIAHIATANGLKPLPSATNFVTIDAGSDGTRARAIVDSLLAHGIFIRMPGVAPLNRCIRISAGKQKDLDLLAEALPRVLEKLR